MDSNFDTHKWFKNQYLNENTLGEKDYLEGVDVETSVRSYIDSALKAIKQYKDNVSGMEKPIDYQSVEGHLRQAFWAFDEVDYSSLD